jgi:hypothetical protein
VKLGELKIAQSNKQHPSIFPRFDEGTQHTLSGKPKLITFPDVICRQASPPIGMDQ